MDIAKNHPLVFCRKLGMVGRMLEEDGRWIKGGAVAGEFGKGKGKEIVVKEMVEGGEEGAKVGGEDGGEGGGGEKKEVKKGDDVNDKVHYAHFNMNVQEGGGGREGVVGTVVDAVEAWSRRKGELSKRKLRSSVVSGTSKRVPFVLPPGWSVVEVVRPGTIPVHIDRYYYEDRSGLKLRSTVEVTAVCAIMKHMKFSAHASHKQYKQLRKHGMKGDDVPAHVSGDGGGGDGGGAIDLKEDKGRRPAPAAPVVKKKTRTRIKVMVQARCWGDYFTENVWGGVCSLLLALPKEVLFLMQHRNSITEVLDQYLKLGWVKLKEGKYSLAFGGQVRKILIRWRRANGNFLDTWLNGRTEGLEGKGRRWKLLRDLGWGGEEVGGEG